MGYDDMSDTGRRRFGFDTYRPDRTEVNDYNSDPDPYTDESGEQSADEIDPKKLVRQPSVNDIRWYYRNGPLAPTIVDKPINDAFKHGYTIDNNSVERFINHIEEPYKRAHRKARRDGFALLWFRLRDTHETWMPPRDVQGIHEVKVLSLDDMSTAKPVAFEEKLAAGNIDNFDERVSTVETEDIATLRDLAREHQSPLKEPSESRGTQVNPEAATENTSSVVSHPYDRSRYYDTTDSGIVMSNRLDDERFEQPIGYLYDRGPEFDPVLIHPSRIFHVAWRRDVDGDVGQETWGRFEGDPVLRPIIHLLRAIHKGNWSIFQSLFRHSSPLHVMEVPEGASDDDYAKAEDATRNINAKSSITEPPNFNLRIEDNETDMDPAAHFDVVFDEVCAGTEFTRSVLFGTQAGTVSGSETDIKNYFNKIERIRENRLEPELRDIVEWWALHSDGRGEYGVPNGGADFDIEWGPLFKLSALDRAEAMARHVQLVTQGASNYVLSEGEARSILDESWADWTDVDLSGTLSESEKEALDRIDWDGDVNGNPRVGQNGGGRETGETNASEQVNAQ